MVTVTLGTPAHDDGIGVGTDNHHTEEHALDDHTGNNHNVLLGIGVDDHHAEDHTHPVADTLTSKLSTSVVQAGNTQTGTSLQSAGVGPRFYVWDAWTAVDDISVSIGSYVLPNETVSPGIHSFVERYAQTAGSTQDHFVTVNGSATSRTIEIRCSEIGA